MILALIFILSSFQTVEIDPEEGPLWPDGFEDLYSQALSAGEEGDFESAIVLYSNALAHIEHLDSPDALNMRALIYNNLADAYGSAGWINISIDTYIKAYTLWSEHFPDSYDYIITILNNMVFMMTDYGDIRAAKHYALQLSEYTDYALEHLITDPLRRLNARILTLFSQFKAATLSRDIPALELLLSDLQFLLDTQTREDLERWDAFLVSMYEMVGYMYRDIKQFDKALYYYDQMLGFPLSDFFTMKYHANTAVALHDTGRYNEALYHLDLSLQYFESNRFGTSYLTLNLLKASIYLNTGEPELSLERILYLYSDLLGRQVQVDDLVSLTYAELNGLNSARHISLLIRSADILQQIESSPDAAINLYRLATDMFNEYYLKKDFNPDLEEFQRRTENGLLALMAGREEDAVIDAVNRLENNKSLQFWNTFINKNGRYRDAGMETNSPEEAIDVRVIQHRLHQGEVIVRYYVSFNEVFALTLQPSGIRLHHLGDRTEISEQVVQLYTQLTSRSPEYAEVSSKLYQTLLDPLDIPEGASLSFIADDVLSYIPFELLLNEGRYLIDDHPVRYYYSLRFAGFNYTPVRHRRFIAAYAPDYSDTQYATIQNGIAEASFVASQFNGTLYAGEDARVANFHNQSNTYAIYHLAMHAEQDPYNYEQSALIFAGSERLPFYRIYDMHLPAEMVVLSACETGIGVLEPGEGLMGLSRALAYSGVKSSVYSLWQVPDRATAEVMISFYGYLKKGYPRDESLRLAKLDFRRENPLMAHPYFWAGFVLNGTNQPLKYRRSAQVLDLFYSLVTLSDVRHTSSVSTNRSGYSYRGALLWISVIFGAIIVIIFRKRMNKL